MKIVRALILLLTVLTTIGATGIAHAQSGAAESPKLTKHDIPKNFPSDLKREVLKLFSENKEKRIKALYILGNTGKRAAVAVPFIADVLHGAIDTPGSEDYELALKAVETLGKIGDKGASKIIAMAFHSNNDAVKKASIVALGKIADPEAVSPLIGALKEGYEIQTTIKAIINMGEPAVKPLLKELDNESTDIRVNAIRVLGKLGDRSAVDPLISKLDDEDPSVRKAAANSLGALKDSRAVDPLIKVFANASKDLSNIIVTALGEIGDPRAYKFMLDGLNDSDKETRISTIRALGALGDRRAVPLLIKALEEDDWNVQRYTTWSLKNLTGQSFGKDKAAWEKWYNENKDK